MFRKIVQDLFAQVQSIDIDPNLVEIPQDRSMGDFALPCFSFAKQLSKAPNAIAEELVEELKTLPQSLSKKGGNVVSKIEAMGPYVNITLNSSWVAEQVIGGVLWLSPSPSHWKGRTFGMWEKQWKTILVEWRSPNTHKMLHVGHLRNALVSETVCAILEFAWYEVIRSAYGGDIGAHVAKWIWYYTNFTDQTYPSDPAEFGIWSWNIYQEATRKIDENPEEYKEQIHETQRLLESWDDGLNTIWRETRELSIAWLQSAFDELWCKIERFYRESEVEQPGIEWVKKYLEDEKIKNIRMSEGAIIADLEEFDLWVFLLLKSNGTSLYSTKDIALIHLKESEYNFDTSLYVVATEQNHHFAQLFKTLELTWYDTTKLHHMWYELVELPDGKMSSRKGTVIPYHHWRDDAISTAKWLLGEREIENKDEVARMVAFAALKFSMLLQDTYKKIRLDMSTALSFEWETGPYLQYTYARCCSIMRKTDTTDHTKSEFSLLDQDTERLLSLHLSEFPELIQKSANEYKPSLVARYVLELARMFNWYYQSTKIILEDDKQTTQARLALVASVQQVLKSGLWLLWIEAPEKM